MVGSPRHGRGHVEGVRKILSASMVGNSFQQSVVYGVGALHTALPVVGTDSRFAHDVGIR